MPHAHRLPLVPAAYVLLTRSGDTDDEVLLQQRQNTGFRDGYWATAAAGHVDAGESVLAAAVRETREELGVSVRAADLEPLTSLHRTDGTLVPVEQRVDWFFRVRRWAGEPRVMEPDKNAGVGWFALSGLPEPVVPHERDVLERLGQGRVPAVLTYGFGQA